MVEDAVADVALELRARLDDALARHNTAEAVAAAVDAVRDKGLPVEILHTRVLTPLLVDTGARWQAGTTQVWEEHLASAAVRTIIESVYLDVIHQASEVQPLGTTALLACPPEEAHDLGLRMLADRLRVRGWNVVFLGQDTPVGQIAEAARAVSANVVVLTAATHYNRLLLRKVIDQLHAALPGVRIGVGGPAFAHEPAGFRDDIITEADLGLDGGA